MSKRRPTPAQPAAPMPPQPRLSLADMERILAVTRALAAPFEVGSLLRTVSSLAADILLAERVTLWMLEPGTQTLVVEVSSDLPPIRVTLGTGIVGQCASTRMTINVPDCYADPRFNPEVDRQTGFRTRCLMALPLVDHQGHLVGALQVVNRREGVFDATDVMLAEALAAQCAVALSRVQMMQATLAAELLHQEMELARTMQRSSLPTTWPAVPGYAAHAFFQPASLTGGDTYDLAHNAGQVLVVLADAAGHGIAPALAVMQMQAMLRMALCLGAPLETAFQQVNDQLANTLPDGHFVNAFIGLLDPSCHTLRYISGGQGPIIQFHASSASFGIRRASSFPMGAMPLMQAPSAQELSFAPGDWLILLSDGAYECPAPGGSPFGKEAVLALVRAAAQGTPAELSERILEALKIHAAGSPQDDDITGVLLKRLPARCGANRLRRASANALFKPADSAPPAASSTLRPASGGRR